MGRRKDKSDIPPAPGDLRIVQAFLNTADLGLKTDLLSTPPALADWLVLHGLLPAGTELSYGDFERAVAAREGLRARLAGGETERQHGALLDRSMAGVAVHPRFAPGAVVRLGPASEGLDGALGRLLGIIAAAQVDGLWPRFKVCASVTCRAAFFDGSRNRIAKWCRPRCGNRVAAQLSRRRKRRYSRFPQARQPPS